MDKYEANAILEFSQKHGLITIPETPKFIDPKFPKQNEFVKDQSRFIVAQCSRRAGKTHALALRFLQTLSTHPLSFCPYIALTRESAYNIMWGVLQELDNRFEVGLKFTESNLTATHPNGSRIQLFGADMKNFINRLKGTKSPGVAIDEAQDFSSHLSRLVDDVLTPTLVDYEDSWLALTGTPGPIPHGFFYEITSLKRYGFSFHGWTINDNPYIENPEGFIQDLITKRKWHPTHPTLLREWRNEWVLDLEALVLQYTEEKNAYLSLPTYKRAWEYVVGVDLGHDDSDAIAVLGWNIEAKQIYLIEEEVRAQQGITELATQLSKVIEKYKPRKVVMDTGGLGKKIAEEIRRRYSLSIEPAEKQRKLEYLELLNDSLRLSHFKAHPKSRFAEDCKRLKWDTETQELKISTSFHSDIIDAVLYAYRECYHWLYEPEKPKLTYGSKEWAEKETSQMYEDALEHFQKQAESEPDTWTP